MEIREADLREAQPHGPAGISPPDTQRMPRLSPQQKLDEERGITPRTIVEGAVRLCIGGPQWQVDQTTEVILKTLDKMAYKIVPMERGDYERS